MARAKFNATRFNVDGLMVSAIPMSIALYLRHQEKPYEALDLLEGVLISLLVMTGCISVGRAIEVGGKGGPI